MSLLLKCDEVFPAEEEAAAAEDDLNLNGGIRSVEDPALLGDRRVLQNVLASEDDGVGDGVGGVRVELRGDYFTWQPGGWVGQGGGGRSMAG